MFGVDVLSEKNLEKKEVEVMTIKNLKMYGMDSQGFPDIDSWAELIIKLPEHKIGKKYRVTYEEIG